MNYNLDIKEKTLENGLHVILVHKPDYHKSLFLVGAGCGGFDIVQEYKGNKILHKSGIAHYLEHQMFYLNGQEVSDQFANLQCQSNAYTSYTETAFYFSTTAPVRTPLKLLLDFVENLDITDQTIEKERGIILSEYDMYQQSPEQRLFKETLISLFHNHPMKIDVLGTKDDIEAMTNEDLTSFYKMNYDPSGLCLVGITGQDTDDVLDWIVQCQKDVKSSIDSKVKRFFPDEDLSVARPYFESHMDIHQPFICIGYKIQPESDLYVALKKDFAVNMWLDSIMGPLNRNYQKYLDERIFTQFVGAEADFSLDHGYILFYAQTNRVDDFIALVDSMVSSVEFEEEAFISLHAQAIANNLRGLDHFDGLANDLLRSYFEGYSYLDYLDMLQGMDFESTKSHLLGLNFSNRCVVKILPNESISSNS